eukprot:m.296130 g.296130  ORF g.296130 m.296130 type:complete len:305 (-) comp65770_c0_seq1:34-948(-)
MNAVHRRPLYRVYHAGLCSLATCLQIVVLLLTLIIPFLIAYRCGGLWMRQASYREQPRVTFNHHVIAELHDATGQLYAFSTFANLNSLYGQSLRAGRIKFRNKDTNADGTQDGSELTVTFPLAPEETVTSARILAFYTYEISEFSRLAIQTIAHAELSRPSGMTKATVLADVGFFQRELLAEDGTITDYNQTLLSATSLNPENYDLTAILQKARAPPYNTPLVNSHHVTAFHSGSTGFSFTLDLTYPTTEYRYRPGVWHELKQSWVQYVAVAIPFYFVLSHIRDFIFDQQFVRAVKWDEGKKGL